MSNFVKKKQVSSGSFVILSELQSLVVPFCEQMSQKGTVPEPANLRLEFFLYDVSKSSRRNGVGVGVWGVGSKHGEGEWLVEGRPGVPDR